PPGAKPNATGVPDRTLRLRVKGSAASVGTAPGNRAVPRSVLEITLRRAERTRELLQELRIESRAQLMGVRRIERLQGTDRRRYYVGDESMRHRVHETNCSKPGKGMRR